LYGHLVFVIVIWYSFSRFGMLCKEESGNPAEQPRSMETLKKNSSALVPPIVSLALRPVYGTSGQSYKVFFVS
jgi:hypothetical protein